MGFCCGMGWCEMGFMTGAVLRDEVQGKERVISNVGVTGLFIFIYFYLFNENENKGRLMCSWCSCQHRPRLAVAELKKNSGLESPLA